MFLVYVDSAYVFGIYVYGPYYLYITRATSPKVTWPWLVVPADLASQVRLPKWLQPSARRAPAAAAAAAAAVAAPSQMRPF